MSNSFILMAIVLSAVVTWLPRIIPFVLTKYKALPDFLLRFLNYLPITIIFALTLSSVITERTGHLPTIKWLELLTVLPTFWVAAKTKNILLAVVVGVFTMACLRLLF
ncbi:AzlD domain-containing protein [Streptococcus macacae]|uniref:Branched-chain amino acid transport protein AzlD n=1 Tax=Streptococcus macacae NCTC 11558 TaxID=764298 RepID=G5JX65_9STRE|nr:AzlD domain-containing protein [Streptococcus macacae]EHJ51739.1 branched-chain amino acid transport protein AzlD [Streptococcus macacae NCTC 11558]SUN77838.1 Branched-chain amino acid transport protein azlD [Streptococcus macacae NCTC 11558]